MIAMVILQLCYLWCADPSPPLTEHQAAVLTCFQTQPWVDRENIQLQRCLERAGCWHDDNGDIRCYPRPVAPRTTRN